MGGWWTGGREGARRTDRLLTDGRTRSSSVRCDSMALLDGGASKDARDAQGETPLDAASRAPGARDEIVVLLGGSVP